MNAVVSLCHFCELHGPSVLMSTQPCRSHNTSSSSLSGKFYGPPECLRTNTSSAVVCEACQSLGRKTYVSSDHDSRTSYVSAQFPWQQETDALVRQACTRSLSCEVSPGKEGVLVFSDDSGAGCTSGSSVLSHTFLVRDSLARGFHRWFSIIVLTRDRILLLNMWPFLEANIALFIAELQSAASKVHEREDKTHPQRALRLNSAYCADRTSRPLSELTGMPHIFAQLHFWFVWLIQGAGTRLHETLPLLDLTLPFESLEETEEGFTLITSKNSHCKHDSSSTALPSSSLHQHKAAAPCVTSLSILRGLLGAEDFTRIVFCLLVGKQIIVRGQPANLVDSILLTLKNLLPKSCIKLVMHSCQYLPPSECNLLGLETRAAVPQPSSQVARLDVLPMSVADVSDCVDSCIPIHQFSYSLRWTGQLPSKLPSFLVKLERAMESQKLSDRTLSYQISALRHETLNSASLLRNLEMQDKRDSGDLRDRAALLQALGVTPHDVEVLSFWSHGWGGNTSKRI